MTERHPSCRTHCCKRHGCKYSYADCPVVLGEEIQAHPCEECEADDAEDAARWIRSTEESPPLGRRLLVGDRDGWRGIATGRKDGRWRREGAMGNSRQYRPDFWRPLPPLPKVGP